MGGIEEEELGDPIDLIALDDALEELAQLDPRQHGRALTELGADAEQALESARQVLGASLPTADPDYQATLRLLVEHYESHGKTARAATWKRDLLTPPR